MKFWEGAAGPFSPSGGLGSAVNSCSGVLRRSPDHPKFLRDVLSVLNMVSCTYKAVNFGILARFVEAGHIIKVLLQEMSRQNTLLGGIVPYPPAIERPSMSA